MIGTGHSSCRPRYWQALVATLVILPPRDLQIVSGLNSALRAAMRIGLVSVAEPARHSSCMVLGICMALAALLLDFLDFHSFGILLSGPSKAAKSTALVITGSVIGFSREKDLPNFRTTDTAFGELPAAFNDMVMPINELGLLKGGATSVTSESAICHMGSPKVVERPTPSSCRTMTSTAVTNGGALVFATGEETLDQISSAAGETRSMGEAIRWIDLRGTHRGATRYF